MHDLQSQKLIGIGHRRGRLYILDELKVPAITTPSLDLYYFHLSHSSSSFYVQMYRIEKKHCY